MIKQRISYRSPGGELSVAASSGLKYGYWPVLMAQLDELYAADAEAAVYRQYQSERGVILSRSAGDMGGHIVHQLLFDEAEDVRRLRAGRPVDIDVYVTRYRPSKAAPESLPLIEPGSLFGHGALSDSFAALDFFFAGGRDYLAAFLNAAKRAASDKSFYLLALYEEGVAGAPERVVRLMELVLRSLSDRYNHRIGYMSFWPGGALDSDYRAMFAPRGTAGSDRVEQWLTRFDMASREFTTPDGSVIIPDEKDFAAAEALLAHDITWLDQERESIVYYPNVADSLKFDLPPFESGMSLYQYVCDWIDELDMRRQEIGDEALNRSVVKWDQLESRIITAGEAGRVHMEYLSELHEVICMLSERGEGDWLRVPAKVIQDLAFILVDSIQWVNVDIYDAKDRELISVICAYERQLRRLPDAAAIKGFALKLDVMRMMGALIGGDARCLSMGVELFKVLSNADKRLLRDVQHCLRWFVESCMKRQEEDELLPLAIILGGVSVEDYGAEVNIRAIKSYALKRLGRDGGRRLMRQVTAHIRSLRGSFASVDLWDGGPGGRAMLIAAAVSLAAGILFVVYMLSK